MKSFRRILFTAALISAPANGALITAPAMAQSEAVTLSSDVMVEKTETAADGTVKTLLKSPKDTIVTPGDKLVITLHYVNTGSAPAANFVATNPLPGPVQFTSVSEDWADVSVDNGATFGKLADLKVRKVPAEGGDAVIQPASAEDVTTVRWVFRQPIPAGAKGELTFRGIVK